MATMLEIANHIGARRKALRITQQDLAFSVGVNRRVIGEIERGKPSVRVDIVLRTLEALGLDITIEPRS
jgi:y4mF family transcriptional regulator